MKNLSFILLGLFFVLVSGCGPKEVSANGPQKPSAVKSTTDLYYGYQIHTVEHDGHLFIWARTGNGLQILHHPDCPCGNKVTKIRSF